MTVLIIAEHNNRELNPATLHAVTAGRQLGEVHVLVAGAAEAEAVAVQAAAATGADKVLFAAAPYYEQGLAEELAPLIVGLAPAYSHIGATATSFAKNLMPRVAIMLDCPQFSDVVEIVDSKTFIRPIYAGNALATVESFADKNVLTFRATAFDAVAAEGGSAVVETVAAAAEQKLSRFVGRELVVSERPELTAARVVVSGGRALASTQQFQDILYPLADALQAAVGASRAAVDAGYAPNDFQVGQTGKVVAPELYIAVGISGAIQHLAGMQDSKTIVAINKDPDAPIFSVADYGLVADLFTAVPELVQQLKA